MVRRVRLNVRCCRNVSFLLQCKVVMWIDVGGVPAMQTLRVYRPRVVIHGLVGMGQGYIGAAALHHLEGFHVQSLELGTLMGDSTRVGCSLFGGRTTFWLISAH